MKDRVTKNINYHYQNAPIPGGGFVTGFVFHNKVKDILYARTDIGGVYRFDFTKRIWESLINHVTAMEKWESYPLSIALDDKNPDMLYIAAGDNHTKNFLCRSRDRGETFEYFPIPAEIHGNAPGRGTGERLQVDPACSNVLYFGSQTKGLLVSQDSGESWKKLSVHPTGENEEQNVAFVWLDPRSSKNLPCRNIVVSVAGSGNRVDESTRGKSLYISREGGKSFEPLPNQPLPPSEGDFRGFVGQRATFDGNYLYVTMASLLTSWAKWNGYACDSGGRQYGCIMRYKLDLDGTITETANITPNIPFLNHNGAYAENAGFGGISICPSESKTLICSSQGSTCGDAIFYSTDKGESWTIIMHRLDVGIMDFSSVSYMRPKFNGGGNLVHWMSDIKIDLFCKSRAVFNTGTGIFMTENLDAAHSGDAVVWAAVCDGVEETVHLNLYSPPDGEVQLIDIVGDLGGFAFTDLTKQCENSFSNEKGDRYITCLNADFPDNNPFHVAVTARGSWSGRTTGGLIWSEDQCKTWRRLPYPLGISPRIDALIENIKKPNTNSGWTAISADESTLIWCVGERRDLPADAVVYTADLGKSWNVVNIYDTDGNQVTASAATMKVLSDRVDTEVFYGYGDGSVFYISTDAGRNFNQIAVPDDFPKLELGGIDGKMPAEIRVQSGKTGVAWISTGEGGLWRIKYDKCNKSAAFERITHLEESVFRQGMGAPAPGSNIPALYINGIIDGEYGFYRSLDEGKSWQRINNEKQMFGDIRSITGDPRTFGRFYIASGSRGVLWGEEVV